MHLSILLGKNGLHTNQKHFLFDSQRSNMDLKTVLYVETEMQVDFIPIDPGS